MLRTLASCQGKCEPFQIRHFNLVFLACHLRSFDVRNAIENVNVKRDVRCHPLNRTIYKTASYVRRTTSFFGSRSGYQ
jgi:hypothetical protein